MCLHKIFYKLLLYYVFFVLKLSKEDIINNLEQCSEKDNIKNGNENFSSKKLGNTSDPFIPVINDISKCINSSLYSYCTDNIDSYPVKHIRDKLSTSSDLKKYSKLFTPRVHLLITSKSQLYSDEQQAIKTTVSNFHHNNVLANTLPVPKPQHGYRRHQNHNQEKSAIVETLCMNVRTTKYLKIAKNKNDNWKYIINQDNYTQAVEIEECLYSGNPCQMTHSFPIGYKTECRQEYSLRVLLSINADGEIIPDLFPLPSCCKCVLYRESDYDFYHN